jgi:hypothetical protein
MDMKQGTNDNNVGRDWLCVWNAHVPPKVRNLIWRISRNCLPTCLRLNERHAPCPINCEICNELVESDWHFLFQSFDFIPPRIPHYLLLHSLFNLCLHFLPIQNFC